MKQKNHILFLKYSALALRLRSVGTIFCFLQRPHKMVYSFTALLPLSSSNTDMDKNVIKTSQSSSLNQKNEYFSSHLCSFVVHFARNFYLL